MRGAVLGAAWGVVGCGEAPDEHAVALQEMHAAAEAPDYCARLDAAVRALGAVDDPRVDLVSQPYATDGQTPGPIYVLEVGDLYVPVPADTYRVSFLAPDPSGAPVLFLRSSRFEVEVRHRVPDAPLPVAADRGDAALFAALDPRPSRWELLIEGYRSTLSGFECTPDTAAQASRVALGLMSKVDDAAQLSDVVAYHGAGPRLGEGVASAQTTLDDSPLLVVGLTTRQQVWWLRFRDGTGVTSVRWQAWRKADKELVARLPPLVDWSAPLVEELVPPALISDAAQVASGDRGAASAMLRHRRSELSAHSRSVLEDYLDPGGADAQAPDARAPAAQQPDAAKKASPGDR